MIDITCRCGAALEAVENDLNQPFACAACGAATTYACGEQLPDGAGAGDFDVALVVIHGPTRVGEQFALGGVAELGIGKLDGKHVQLPGTRVSRSHCSLARLDFGPSRWEIVDNRSTNGLYVNGQRVDRHEIAIGDRIAVGEYVLEARDATPVPVPVGSVRAAAASVADAGATSGAPAAPAIPSGPTKPCPKCKQPIPAKAKFCVGCGTDLSTGKRAVLSKDIDENALYVRAENTITLISWLIPFGLFPIASEALGGRKPIVTWIVTGLTAVCSIAFMIAMSGGSDAEIDFDDEASVAAAVDAAPSPAVLNLMLWSGRPEEISGEIDADVEAEIREELRDARPKATATEIDREIAQIRAEAKAEAEAEALSPEVGFRWYQLVTHAFLHDFSSWIGLIFHFGGNLLFLMVFGLRVNELIGQWRFAVSYLLLAAGAGLAHHVMSAADEQMPMLGASGAIMGLAGMYLVLFPRQGVYMSVWLRLGIFTGFRLAWKIWRMPGFWLLVMWIAWNDVLPVALQHLVFKGKGGGDVAHWAHLGGFVCGIVLAMLWLVTRQVHAHGHDLISSIVGPRASSFIRQG